MTGIELQQSLNEAIAPDDAYELPASLEPPADELPLVPDDPCHEYECEADATRWVRFLDPYRMLGFCAEHDGGGKPMFLIQDDRMASWALRKQGDAARAVATREREVEELYQEELARLNEWRDGALNSGPMNEQRRTAAFMSAHLIRYLRRIRRDDPKRNKIAVPAGTVKVTRSQTITVVDEAAVVAWATEQGYADVFVKEEARAGEIKKRLMKTADGILLPKIAVGDSGEVFEIPGILLTVKDNYDAVPT